MSYIFPLISITIEIKMKFRIYCLHDLSTQKFCIIVDIMLYSDIRKLPFIHRCETHLLHTILVIVFSFAMFYESIISLINYISHASNCNFSL